MSVCRWFFIFVRVTRAWKVSLVKGVNLRKKMYTAELQKEIQLVPLLALTRNVNKCPNSRRWIFHVSSGLVQEVLRWTLRSNVVQLWLPRFALAIVQSCSSSFLGQRLGILVAMFTIWLYEEHGAFNWLERERVFNQAICVYGPSINDIQNHQDLATILQ